MDEKRIDNLRRLAKSSVSEDGRVRPFAEQLSDYALGAMPEGEAFVLAESVPAIHSQLTGGTPLTMPQHGAKKMAAALGVSLKAFGDLPEWLENHPLAMESITSPNALAVVVGVPSAAGGESAAILTIGKTPVNGAYELSPAVSVLDVGKDLPVLLDNAAKLGKTVLVNERTEKWLDGAGVELPSSVKAVNERDGAAVSKKDDLKSISNASAIPHEGLWWSPSEQIAFWVDTQGETEPRTWQNVDPARLSEALDGKVSPDYVAASLGGADFGGKPLAALSRTRDWEQMPDGAVELERWKQSVVERIDLAPESPSKAPSAQEPPQTSEEQKTPLDEQPKQGLFKKLFGGLAHDKSTARQDESRVHAQARGDDANRPTRAAEQDLSTK